MSGWLRKAGPYSRRSKWIMRGRWRCSCTQYRLQGNHPPGPDQSRPIRAGQGSGGSRPPVLPGPAAACVFGRAELSRRWRSSPLLFGRSLGGFSTVVVSANKTLLTGACQRVNQEFELPGEMTTILKHYQACLSLRRPARARLLIVLVLFSPGNEWYGRPRL